MRGVEWCEVDTELLKILYAYSWRLGEKNVTQLSQGHGVKKNKDSPIVAMPGPLKHSWTQNMAKEKHGYKNPASIS